MPNPRNYNAGSVIYFEGEKPDYIYVLKSGKVVLDYISVFDGMEQKDQLKPGEFFGVKSVLGNFPREETATAVQASTVLLLSVQEFEKLASAKFQITMSMLKSFSTQLRELGKKVRKYLSDGSLEQKDVELYKIGNYYLKNKKLDKAMYIFTKYLEYYPSGQYASEAKERLDSARKGIALNVDAASEKKKPT